MIRELILNIILWPLIHLAVSKWSLHRSNYSFDYSRGIYRLFNFERTGRFYRHYVKVTSWKRRLPDGAKWLGHDFIKEAANLRDAAHVERFLRETCRSEWAHWVTLMFVPIFFIWNPLWADFIMIAYGILANLPCIIAQRYNRAVLLRIRGRHPS